jgi:hypothetical protein
VHECEKKEQWGELKEKLKQYDKHLDESDSHGGYRDRVADVERGMRLVPYVTAACAFCGGLVAQIVPQLGIALADLIEKFH